MHKEAERYTPIFPLEDRGAEQDDTDAALAILQWAALVLASFASAAALVGWLG